MFLFVQAREKARFDFDLMGWWVVPEVEVEVAIMAATSTAKQVVIACSLTIDFAMEEIDIMKAVSLTIELVEESSAGSEALVDIISRKLEKEQVLAVEFNLMMPIAVNSIAKAIGGRILVEVGSLAMAVHTVPN